MGTLFLSQNPETPPQWAHSVSPFHRAVLGEGAQTFYFARPGNSQPVIATLVVDWNHF